MELVMQTRQETKIKNYEKKKEIQDQERDALVRKKKEIVTIIMYLIKKRKKEKKV